MLWVDKHQPRYFDQLSCHPELTELLQCLSKNGNIPHLLLYGPSGGGKKTRSMALLRALFGPGIDKVKADVLSPEGVSAEFICCSSMFHHQISASELGSKDRVCVQYLIKQLASQRSATSFTVQTGPKFRVFVIQEAERLSYEAQAGLRRTLEKCAGNARVILHCQQLSSIMQPLRSRCLCIRVPLPSKIEVLQCLQSVCKKELINDIPEAYLLKIAENCNRSLRRAILMLQVAAMQNMPPIASLQLPWEVQCTEIADKVTKNPGMRTVIDTREMLYELLTSQIPAELILETVCKKLLQKPLSQTLQCNIIRAAAHYAFTMKRGAKDIFHLEAFIAQCLHFCRTCPPLK